MKGGFLFRCVAVAAADFELVGVGMGAFVIR